MILPLAKIGLNEANEANPDNSPLRVRIVEQLRANPKATLQQVADSVGLSLAGVKKIVGGLTESGLLTREGSKKAGRWVALK